MKLYLLEREHNLGLDEMTSAVVAANSEEEAITIAEDFRGDQSPVVWRRQAKIRVIGTAARGTKAGLVHEGFWPG